MTPRERAEAVKAATDQEWSARPGGALEKARGERTLVVDRKPEFIRNAEGGIVGVDVWVRLPGTDIDPHRRIINPPTVPRANVRHEERVVPETGEVERVRIVGEPDPQAAFWEVVWDSVEAYPNPGGRGTVTTVFGDTADGDIESESGTYSNARAGTSLLARTTFAFMEVGQFESAFVFHCVESFISFDTSAIDDSDTVSSIVLDIWLDADNTFDDFVIEARESDWGSSLTTADWVAGASLGGLTLMASIDTDGWGSAGQYKTLTSEGAFLTATNLKTGTVRLLLCSNQHRLGNEPSANEYVELDSANESGTSQDPKLTITHEVSNTAPTADAGADQSVDEGETVNLDGTGSTDAEDGQAGLSYEWTVQDADGTGLGNGDISNRLTDSASFTAPEVVGADVNIVIQLEVEDTGGLTDTDTVTITVSDTTLVTKTGAGGLVFGGNAPNEFQRFMLLEKTGAGGLALAEGLVNINTENPGFETDAGGWFALDSTLVRSTDQAKTGAASGELTPDGGNPTVTAGVFASESPEVIAERSYVTSVWVYSPSGYSSVRVRMSWLDSDDAILSTEEGTPTAIPAGEWTKLSVTGTAPASAVKAGPRITMGDSPASGDVLYIDDMHVGLEVAFEFQRHMLLEKTGAGGLVLGGNVVPKFVAPQVPSDIVVEWDFDNDGDFDEPEEDITSFVLGIEARTGRDWPSLLTGKAGPGQLRCTLRNDDDRFSFFNSSSPLNEGDNSLLTGRKLRVRTTGATTSPDPTLLVRDRFRRSDGSLGTAETGQSYTEPFSADFEIDTNNAVATDEGEEHIAVVDAGAADYYVQATLSVLGQSANRVGLIYRYVDSNDYSLAYIDVEQSAFILADVVSGTEQPIVGTGIETYDNIAIGVLVEDDEVTGYLEGVSFLTATAIQTSAQEVGIYAEWASGDTRPEIASLHAWNGLPQEVEGILWTGNISGLNSDVQAGPQKLAQIDGRGPLSKAATVDIQPPTSIEGRKTGLLVGNSLAMAGLLHPPCEIAEGNVITGPFAIEKTTALEVARRVEETEFGFLYETQEGLICFNSRTARDGATSQAIMSDGAGTQFGFHRIVPFDWRRELFNRVQVGISPWSEGTEDTLYTDPGPHVLTSGQSKGLAASSSSFVARWTGHTRDVTIPEAPSGIAGSTDTVTGDQSSFSVDLPATVDSGDLLLVAFSWIGTGGWDESVPSGWSLVSGTFLQNARVIAKVADGSEDGTSITLSTSSDTAGWDAHVFRVIDWYGDLDDGVRMGGRRLNEPPNPGNLTTGWGNIPTLWIALWTTFEDVSSQTGVPSGYSNGLFVAKSGTFDGGMGSARKVSTASSEDPGAFSTSPSVFANNAWVIAVRGDTTTTQVTKSKPSGVSPAFTIAYDSGVGGSIQSHENIQVTGVPFVEGDVNEVQVDDHDSQDEHDAIRTYHNSANLFASGEDAEDYGDLVLAQHADDRPIISISFYATKSMAHRMQAIRRRVSDKITLVADNNAGLGINGDFFIESIDHRWSHGLTLWETTWELSPVPAE